MTTTPPDARNALAEIVAQIEWLKSRLADLQLPASKRDHDTREKWLLQCGMPPACIEAVEAEHRMEIADMADTFRAVNVERVFAQMKPDMVDLIAQANADKARIAALEAQVEGMRVALEPFAHIGGSEALTSSLPPKKGIIAYDGSRRLFAVDWSCFVKARAALQSSETTGEK